MGTFKFYYLSKFQLYNTVFPTIVTMLHIRSSEHIHLITESFRDGHIVQFFPGRRESRSFSLGNSCLITWPPGNCCSKEAMLIPLLFIYPDNTIIQKDIRTSIFIEALCTIARTWKQPKCPLMDEWIKKMWYMSTLGYYSAIKQWNHAICSNVDGPK